MRTPLLFAAAVALLSQSFASAVPMPEKVERNIDVAICLDTSNSMDGLIESAKLKLWTIVNDLAKIRPVPTLRVALYQYGNDHLNQATGWVRKELDLTQDLDEVYKQLNALKTNGGTELVARVCRDALNDLKWSEGKDALRLVFVCGNEPADQDKQVHLQTVAEAAKKKGIFVNTIYCGPVNHPEAALWKEFAIMAGGEYANIDQDRARAEITIKTPHDDELLKLNNKLNGTYVVYGGKDGKEKQANQVLQDVNAAKASPTAALDRVGTKRTTLYRCDTWDLVDRMKNDPKFDLKSIKEEELCEEIRAIKPEEREAYIKKKAAERDEIRKQIAELDAKRNVFIQDELKKRPKSAADAAFDDAVRGAIRGQAAQKGFQVPNH